VLSAEGKQMLKFYNTAVAKMMDTTVIPEGSPRSWLFQWYTHSVRRGVTKAQELARVYPSAGPSKALATEMWSTCQAHVPGSVEKFFLPWHRMYVFFFERLIRSLSDPSFTLPYWNYTDAANHGVLPETFRSPRDPAFAKLYVQGRNVRDVANGWANVNGGEPVDKYQTAKLNLDALNQPTYQPKSPEQGFCSKLDGGLHGNLHVYVGNQTNMGDVPWAAKDPVFWVHHCNIDRLWASWATDPCRRATTPTADADWQTREFVFADENGTRVAVKAKDFDDMSKMAYTYEHLETVTPLSCTAPAPNPNTFITLSAPTRLNLKSALSEVALTAPTANSGSFKTRVRNLAESRRVFLVLRKLQTNLSPGVMYYVYLDLPGKVSPPNANANLVGAINFFSAVQHEADPNTAMDHAAMDHPDMDDRFFSFDVTSTLQAMEASGTLNDKPKVTIAPFGKPSSAATPVVGEISFVETN